MRSRGDGRLDHRVPAAGNLYSGLYLIFPKIDPAIVFFWISLVPS